MADNIENNDDVEQNLSNDSMPDGLSDEWDNILSGGKVDDKEPAEADNDEPDNKDSDELESLDEDSDSEPIPERLVDAGKAAGLTDEKIVTLAEDFPDVLESLAQMHEAAFRLKEETKAPEAEKKSEDEQPISHFDMSDLGTPEKVNQALTTLAAQHNKLVDTIESLRGKAAGYDKEMAERQAQIQRDYDDAIDSYFDKVAANLPELGNSDKLNQRELKKRQEIFNIADALEGPLKQRLDKAVKAFEGMYGKAEQTLRKKLDKNKRRFSPRPSGKKTNPKFKTGTEAATKAFDDKWDELGL